MYKNAGAKVKGLATFVVVLMMIVCVIAGFGVMVSGRRGSGTLPGLLIIVGGCFAAWLSGLMLAAFGELVENSYYIRKMLAEGASVPTGDSNPVVTAKPDFSDVSVTHAEINAVMQRDGVAYGEAVVIAKKEKMNGGIIFTDVTTGNSNVNNEVCPNCGSPRKNNSTFCGYCGTRL